MVRSAAYFVAYWLITAVFALACSLLALLPGRKPLAYGIQLYGSAQRVALFCIAGISIEVRGKDRLPREPSVIAAKHQSWGDGFVMISELAQLSFVAGDHLYKFPLVGRILNKLGAIVLSNGGGDDARARMNDSLDMLRHERRDVLIYPEGHLAAPGEKHAYRKGVWHLYAALNRPCTPVATNLGLAWNQQSFRKMPGRAVVEFLDPIEPGLEKDEFMARLEAVIEARTDALVKEGLT
ncbi:MAG: 1-acyl-sn-glycerol-3-phosphate acyltransferase [Oceanicaulis sp.]|uniref:lysophospholipid acyltransferase family protein n=1 Tax=Oceanicaulis sp. UBA2681 TaxID=1947007 RepID=UPI000C0AA64B|nr:lysophospholipid acyltransferase family protein [Oceanicaulis sp. UBA2681]MAP48448.1 1-acyl-sn-glycerol-3-phosphate acyltransferase [Oceanicaulis sp.]|tara:strand:+ start:3624 stop:4337 length:714 start_codon:yes stop_codon:yes gene_type:complete